MSDKLGPRTFGDKQELVFLGREISEQKDYGEKVADAIDAEVNRIIQQAQETAREILTKNRAKLELIAQRLIAEETLEGEELEALFKEPAPKAS
jgi:cell division protease FtsH